MRKELGQRSDAELEALFGNMYSGWDRGVNVTQERFGDGETRFTETPMTPLELAARYVAAEIGANIYEIANRAAFAPITVFSQIQARIGPVFDEAATALEAKEAEITALRERVKELEASSLAIENAKLRTWIDLHRGDTLSLSNEVDHFREAAQEAGRKLAEARAALKPFATMANAMYVSGHCGGAFPEDWPDKWSVTVQGGKDFHTPQQHGGLLKVEDFRRAARAVIEKE